MFLAILLSSLPTILKLSRDTSWPVVFWWSMMGDGALMCSLYLSPNVLPDSPMYSSSQSTLPHLYLYITPLFLSMVSLSLGCTRRPLIVLPPLKYTSTPYLLQMFLQVSPKPFIYGCSNTQYREQGETLPAMVTNTPSTEEPPVATIHNNNRYNNPRIYQ